MTLTQWLFSFRGRLRRRDWWAYFIPSFVIRNLGYFVGLALGGLATGLTVRFGLELMLLWPTLAVCTKRLRDQSRSPWWLLILLPGPIHAAASTAYLFGGPVLPVLVVLVGLLIHLAFDGAILVLFGALKGRPTTSVD